MSAPHQRPPITPKYRPALPLAYWSHFALAWAILLLTASHAGAALYHHFVRPDRVLTSMLPGRHAAPGAPITRPAESFRRAW